MRLARWLQRRFYRYQPGAILAVFAVLVGVPLILDFVPPVHHWLDEQAKQHEVGVNLLEHVAVAALVAAAAFYWVLGLKRQQALKKYRSRACRKPWELVEWSQGERPVVREAMAKLLADGVARSPEPAVAVVQGRAGTGRTNFVVGLVQELAKKNLIPIPVLARRDGSFGLEALAREVFCQHIDEVLSSDQQADAIWHRAKQTRDVVILVDGLDDEVVGMLWREDGIRFRQAVTSLGDKRIAVVLVTTRKLPLGKITPLREDLDIFSRDEANSYLRQALEGEGAPPDEAIAALDRLPDPVDDTLVVPLYLDLLVRLQVAGISLRDLPEHTDPWRAAVLGMYLDGIGSGRIVPGERPGDADAPDRRIRARAAKKAAEALARELTIERADLTVGRRRLEVDDRALDDAEELNLLWHGAERVGFAGDDLGAYLVAATTDDASELLKDVHEIAESESPGKRRDRHALLALIFWYLQHDCREQAETFDRLLTELMQRHWTRPVVVAAAVRIASTCGVSDATSEGVAKAVRNCIDSLDTAEERDAQRYHAGELLKLVRALAEWHSPAAHRLLWYLATNRNTEVDWLAAKALATATGAPGRTLEPEIEEVLQEAERQADPVELSDPENDLGNRLASLAWILPALRGTDELAEEQVARLSDLCLAETMSPLRGEMSLAQGLKLAIVNERTVPQNVAHARNLLESDGRLRFWHARLVLVQAMLAHSWKQRDSVDELGKRLDALRSKEPHPLVKGGIDLARRGLRDLKRSSNGSDPPLGRYMWNHERDVVKWVEQGKTEMTQLAADVVLLSNMTYRLRRERALEADRIAAETALPRCILKSSARRNITEGCACPHGLCGQREPPAVIATRARFSESFCREQARLVARLGPPKWTRGGLQSSRRLKSFWDEQATITQGWSTGPDGR